MPLFVPDKTKFKNLTSVPLNVGNSVTVAISQIFKNKLYLFRPDKQYIEYTDQGARLKSLPTDSVSAFAARCSAVFKGKILLFANRNIDTVNYFYYSSDGTNWTTSKPFGGTEIDARAMVVDPSGEFVLCLNRFGPNGVWKTTDGVNWTIQFYLNAGVAIDNSYDFTNGNHIFNYIPSLKKFVFGFSDRTNQLGALCLVSSDGTSRTIKKYNDAAVSGLFPCSIIDVNGVNYGFFCGENLSGSPQTVKIFKLDANLNLLEEITGDLVLSNNAGVGRSSLLYWGVKNSFFYVVCNDGRVYIQDGGKFKIIGTVNTQGLTAFIGGGAFEAYAGRLYLGQGPYFLSSTL